MTPKTRQKIEQIRRGEVPDGYKKTKVGIVPVEWEIYKLSAISTELYERAGDGNYETLSISAGIGFVNQANKFGKEISGAQYSKYTVLAKGDFSYNKGNSKKYPQGCIYQLKDRAFAAVPNVFESFRLTKGNNDFFEQLFIHGFLNSQLFSKINHGVRDDGLLNLRSDDFYSSYVVFPSLVEQEKIAEILSTQDKVIELQTRKIAQLKILKKGCLQRLFPKKGCNYPELRFKGFTDAWEQRKFSELVLIERGGSPRPIDDYITNSPNGLNWVKIGDAPLQGHYITKTAEKIKREGLSKTRQVQPGDLILSNSMSFGKPYIMGMNGCIHDGWLLIRDIHKRFDVIFLCHLLGTSQMLGQYKSFAAGSTVNNLNKELVGNTVVTIPKIDEQKVLGQYFEELDYQITLHQRKLDEEIQKKKALMQFLLTGIVRTI